MDTKELLKKVRKIEIKSKGISNHLFSGEYHSAFKGQGMAFSEVREYAPGDPIRTIDWNVTARFDKPYVKIFEEERELTVMLLIDLSASNAFGTTESMKNELIAELCAVIAFSASQNNDKIGAILFTDQLERFIPPKKGRSHILGIIREIISHQCKGKSTNLNLPLNYLVNTIKKRSTVFLISDFIDAHDYTSALKIAGKKHDLIALLIADQREREFPDVGWIPLKDLESDEVLWLNTSKQDFQVEMDTLRLERDGKIQDHLKKSGIDFARIETGKNYIKPLISIFNRRGVGR